MKVGVIPEFRGEYYFLSNFYTAPFVWRGKEFQSGEQAFSYAKTFYAHTDRVDIFQRNILAAKTPGDAKKFGRAVPLISVEEWDNNRVAYMREIVHQKFLCVPGLAGQLINTGAMLLVEGNNWGDTFWGRCEGKGFNTLGAILMEERGYWLKSDFKEK